MVKRRCKPAKPIMLLWTREDLQRFVDALENFYGLVEDLSALTRAMEEEWKRRPRRRPAAPPLT